jgi:tRNA threonylcarbamoyl adenosine modification protein (Sua5/YciO/YrdC/YwlC family)
MAERIRSFTADPVKLDEAVALAVRYLNAGQVIIVAAEIGYVYLADAFDADAVKTIHILRGDSAGVAAQVFIKNSGVLAGIAAPLTPLQNEVLDRFWPGLISVTLKSQAGVNWNLGDERRLGLINVRVPNREFLGKVLEKTGPLATASIAFAGKPAITDLSEIIIREGDVGAVFDEGVLEVGVPTTILNFSENEITLMREGAVTISQLQPLIPSISTVNL